MTRRLSAKLLIALAIVSNWACAQKVVSSGRSEASSSALEFSTSSKSLSTHDSEFEVQGTCQVPYGYDHKVLWTLTSGSVRMGEASNICRFGQLSFSVNMSGMRLEAGLAILEVTLEGTSPEGESVILGTGTKTLVFVSP